MDHRPFEDWLLADEPLSSQQKRELQAHLRTCTDCAALAEVNLALEAVKPAAPAVGFAGRFQVRLAAQKKALRRRNFFGFLVLSLIVIGIAGWLLWPVLSLALQSPVNLLATWFASLVSLWASLQAMESISSALLRVIPGFIPAYVWLGIIVAGGGSGLLWVLSLKKFTNYPRGV